MHKMWWRNYPRPFSEKPKLSISLDQQSKLLYSFIVCYVEGNQNILKLSGRPLAFITCFSSKAFLGNKKRSGTSLPASFLHNFWRKIFFLLYSSKARLKNMLVSRHPGLFFRVHPAGRKKKFCIILSFKSSLTD